MDLVHLGLRIRQHRRDRGLSLERLSTLSGVSASMLSSIERGTKAATVVSLDRIAQGLGVPVHGLLEPPEPERVVVRRANEQDHVTEDGWHRTILSPVVPGVNFEMIQTVLAPHTDAGEFPAYAPGSHEYIVVEEGTLTITIGNASHQLSTHDSIYFAADITHGYANNHDKPCRYYVAAIIMRARTKR